jgi:hypothetical protein
VAAVVSPSCTGLNDCQLPDMGHATCMNAFPAVLPAGCGCWRHTRQWQRYITLWHAVMGQAAGIAKAVLSHRSRATHSNSVNDMNIAQQGQHSQGRPTARFHSQQSRYALSQTKHVVTPRTSAGVGRCRGGQRAPSTGRTSGPVPCIRVVPRALGTNALMQP